VATDGIIPEKMCFWGGGVGGLWGGKALLKSLELWYTISKERIMQTVQMTAEGSLANPLNPETIWAILQEVAERQKKTERIVENNAQLIGKLGGRFGEMIEYMVMPNLIEKFQEFGFVFTRAFRDVVIKDKENNIFTEIDITLENGDKVMIVEVKSKPTTEDIADHIERMEKVRAHANLHNDNRKYLGAIAGMVFNDNVKVFAMKNGFFVIEPSGETFNITKPNGEPKEW
jgi:hypothetical protein